ncbi:MAG: secondary thiamine-phosphate synthase enzyme YjbQ [Nanoarchaeota archaeon]|nr:secondary thiamine-phosphate synthase enzyme YjbQ [Nanoarchaeota archaeon]
MCQIYTPHATAALAINENWDPNIGLDLLNALDQLIPQGKWLHDQVDNNGAAHIKSAIIGPSETIPFINKKLQLGRWQNIIFCDFDGPRKRKIIITLLPFSK